MKNQIKIIYGFAIIACVYMDLVEGKNFSSYFKTGKFTTFIIFIFLLPIYCKEIRFFVC